MSPPPALADDPRRARTARWVVVALFFFGLALFSASENPWQSAFVGHQLGTAFPRVLFYYCVHWGVWAALLPLVARLARRYPLAPRPLAHGALHLLFAIGIGAVQLIAMRALIQICLELIENPPPIGEWLRHDFQTFAHRNLMTYFVMVAAVAGLDAYRRAREEEVRTSRLAEQLAEARLAALQMQIHPHFLFNSLHTAAELVHEDPALAEKTLLRLADLLRRALRVAAREDETLAESLEFVDGYLELEGVRLEGRMRVAYEVPEALLAARIPTLLLQPLVENAVRHGVARRQEPGEIVVRARAIDGALELAVVNDRPTRAQAPMHAGAGIGLANVRARLAHLFGDAASLRAEAEGDRYVATIRLPLSSSAPEATHAIHQPQEVPT